MSAARARGVASPAIARVAAAARAADPTDFWTLRAATIAAAQAASDQSWTDYNLHDPGVTLIEALCYALTELIFRIDYDVADHLCDDDGRIDGPRQGLFAADAIFPARPLTALDICQTLLDGNPDTHDAWLTAAPRRGLLRLLVHADGGAASVAALRRSYDAHRSLGEDLDDEIALIATATCRLAVEVELTGGRGAADIVAEIFLVCERLLSPPPRVIDRRTLKAAGEPLETIYRGPLTRAGIIGIDARRDPRRSISASELRACIAAVDGVAAVNSVGIRFDRPTPGSMAWTGQVLTWNARTAVPLLLTPDADAMAAMRDIRLQRRTTLPATTLRADSTAPIAVAAAAVKARFRDMRAGRRSSARALDTAPDLAEALPRGRFRAAPRQASIGALLPPVYGLGDARLPGDDDRAPPASPGPLAAFLSLIDQVLLGSGAQISHLRHLFTTAVRDGGGYRRSYWPQLPGDDAIAGIETLYDAADASAAGAGRDDDRRRDRHADIARRVFGGFDDALARRQRILDFLLALYGEQVAQDVLGRFFTYLDSREVAAVLLDNKAAWLAAVDTLTRDRGAGPDLARPAWDSAAAPGFHHRMALLLGFARPQPRRLARRCDPAVPPPAAAGASRWPPLDWPPRRAGAAQLPAIDPEAPLPSPLLFRDGVDRAAYRWHPGSGRLALAPAESDTAIDLGHFATAADAAQAAAAMRNRLLAETAACEGLHIVEHILLRRRWWPAHWWQDSDSLAFRVTLVLPGWTARTQRPAFRNFAEEVARIHCPAHLAIRCCWLDQAAMLAFEDDFERWRAALSAHLADPDAIAAAIAVDAAAVAVSAVVMDVWPEVALACD